MLAQKLNHRPRSFVRRNSRKTIAQTRAQAELLPIYGIPSKTGQVNFDQYFPHRAPLNLEIGFGSGASLLSAAEHYPDKNFIGIETHEPGIGALLMGIEKLNLNNLRIFYGDAVEVIEQCIPDATLSCIQIFFPDPWPKRRHHERRLIQENLIAALTNKLIMGGSLHLATDWQDYAIHMMKILSRSTLTNPFGENVFATRSCYRPIITKFEGRAITAGRNIWDLQFIKNNER